jgi:hypothetical protein
VVAGTVGVVLAAAEFIDVQRWRWVLTGPGGSFLADYQVELPGSDWQAEAFADLQGYLRWHAAPDDRLTSEANLCAQVGDWITEHALGPGVAAALAARPGPVRLVLPGAAEVLAYRPWQLARANRHALAAQRVTFVTDPFDRYLTVKTPVGDRLRMLAVFSLPEDAGALNLRRERHALARMIHHIAATQNKAVHLQVLQYGATRDRLEDLLLEGEGWDILHLSGHGLPAGLLLETDAGQPDLIITSELVDLLSAAADRLSLVTLSACESAALTAADHLHLLGLPPIHGAVGAADSGGTDIDTAGGAGAGLGVLARALVESLDVAVLAMRYPVVDDFAIGLAEEFYRLVIGKAQPVDRALGLALHKVLPSDDVPTAGIPALSVGTPALFGARALGLALTPPAGEPVVFQPEQQKLKDFPAQPERFVGRVGPMTRAAALLAPASGKGGLVLHGMAGAGKTACALELAYNHQDSFTVLVWHAAPAADRDISTAFAGLLFDLDRQIPGLQLAHLAEDPAGLATALPAVTEFLQYTRVLIVFDNLESVLANAGTWRDARWDTLIRALTPPAGGLSRLILTSRTRPVDLPPGLHVEIVHALSLTESVLLAREWPHLRALIDTPATRPLAARVLSLVQGHPKLLELAEGQAGDPAALTTRLNQAEYTWTNDTGETGETLQAFLHTGQSHATAGDYYTVLTGWTRHTSTDLPDPARILLTLLAATQPEDRTPAILHGIWPTYWATTHTATAAAEPGRSDDTVNADPDSPGAPGLPSDSAAVPELATALALLVERALVAAQTEPATGEPVLYRLHPAVAEATRADTPADTASAIDNILVDYWLTAYSYGIKHEAEGYGWLVLRAARAAITYLHRTRDWATLIYLVQNILFRDRSLSTAATLLPLLQTAADATTGTSLELSTAGTLLAALARLRPADAEPRMRALLEMAAERGQHGAATGIAGDLINLYRETGRLADALAVIDTEQDHMRRAGLGPWSQLGVEGQRLQILLLQGHTAAVLTAVQDLRARMADLPETSDQPEAATPWNVRETILDTGRSAALRQDLWQLALDLNNEQLDSMRARGASVHQLAYTAFNDATPLRELGRTGETRQLLQHGRQVFEADQDVPMLGKVLTALAILENQSGHPDAAAALQRDALRLSYATSDSEQIGLSHHNLANYLTATGDDAALIGAHRYAAALIGQATGSGYQTTWLRGLSLVPDAGLTYPEICALVDRTTGVHLDRLLRALSPGLDGTDALSTIRDVLSHLPAAASPGFERLLAWWEPVLGALVAESRPDTDPDTVTAAGSYLHAVLATRAELTDWAALTAALVGLRADPTATAPAGMDALDAAIYTRAAQALAGEITLNPDPAAWTTVSDDGGADGDGG